jgi:N-acetylglutamate synthase-like GNAT family acetyltransferase
MTRPKPGKCHIRRSRESDIEELERMYRAHEGNTIPPGYFADFQATLRDARTHYFVATVDERVIGGGGISSYEPGDSASLTFGIVDPDLCGKGYGTAILLARLLFVNSGALGCRIFLQATQWSAAFFARLGFKWHAREQDDAGHHFLSGSHVVLPGDERVFARLLAEGGVTLDFEPDRG